MTEDHEHKYPTKEQAIHELWLSLELLARELNAVLVEIAGPEAEWSPGPPYEGLSDSEISVYQVTKDQILQIAALREEANSALQWLLDHPQLS